MIDTEEEAIANILQELNDCRAELKEWRKWGDRIPGAQIRSLVTMFAKHRDRDKIVNWLANNPAARYPPEPEP